MTPADMTSLTSALTKLITLTKQQEALTSEGAYTRDSLNSIVDAIAKAQKELDAVQAKLKGENKIFGGRTRRHRRRTRKTRSTRALGGRRR